MQSVSKALTSFVTLAVAFLYCTAFPAIAWAKKAVEEEVDTGKSYTLGYALVVMGIGLGLMLVLRPVGRTTEIKLPKSE